MHVRAHLALILAAVLSTVAVVAGCQQREAGPAQTAAPPAAPVLKAGLWEKRWSQPGLDAVQRARFCVDDASQAKTPQWPSEDPAAGCGPVAVFPAGLGAWRFAMSCDRGSGGKSAITGEASGDFSARYQTKVRSVTIDAALAQMNRTDDITAEIVWMGPCPAELKPGQFDAAVAGNQGQVLKR